MDDPRIPRMTDEDRAFAESVRHPGTHEQRIEKSLRIIAVSTTTTAIVTVLSVLVLLIR